MTTRNQQQEFTPKRSAFFEQMKQLQAFPYYNSFVDSNINLPVPRENLLDTPQTACGENSTPITNRGVTGFGEKLPPSLLEQLGLIEGVNYSPKEDFRTIAVGSGSKYQLVRIPVGMDISPNYASIDWVNFTFKRNNYISSPLFYIGDYTDKKIMVDFEEMIVADVSRHLINILGYGVTTERETGSNYYKRSFELGTNDWGHVCIGGQEDTVMVMLKGQGLLAAKSGWEQRLFDFMSQIPEARLTRIDLSHDNFNSATSIFDYFQMYLADLFTVGYIRPTIKQDGDWVNENDKGRTLYIGKRTSGKLLRIYEKGKQLGGQFSQMFPDWVRVELEYHNKGRDLPLDILLKPGAYLAGGYPALVNLYKEQEVVELRKKSLKIRFDRAIEVVKHQFGKYLHAIAGVFGVEQAFQILTDGKEELPKRLDDSDYRGFDKEAFLSGLNIDFKTLEELTARLGFDDMNSFLAYNQFKLNPVPF